MEVSFGHPTAPLRSDQYVQNFERPDRRGNRAMIPDPLGEAIRLRSGLVSK
jgi:hypothetical protein